MRWLRRWFGGKAEAGGKPRTAEDRESRRSRCRAQRDRGNQLLRDGLLGPAERCYRQALAIDPDDAEGYVSLGYALMELNSPGEAESILRQGLTLNPRLEDAYFLLGTLHEARDDIDAATEAFEGAVAIRPRFPEALHHLATLYRRQGRLKEALSAQQRQLAADPQSPAVHSDLLLTMLYDPALSPADWCAEARRFAERHETPLRGGWIAHGNIPDPERRLRVAYLSPDFRSHTVGYLFLPIIEAHDRSRFEIICYHASTASDAITQRIAGLADRFVSCHDLDDEALSQRIRGDGIDILLDLAGHTGGNRLAVLARKPAPVQMTWLGNPATTGLSAVDYRMTDADQDPPGLTEPFHSEVLFRLPASPLFPMSAEYPPVSGLPVLASGFFTFACLNNVLKMNEQVAAVWARILSALPGARLMLGNVDSERTRARLVSLLTERGIAAERLILKPRMELSAFLKLHHEVDLALDTFPFCGLATSLHALWMGVPVLTLAGSAAAGRQGVSLLRVAGRPEFIAQSQDDYVEKAVDWARRPRELNLVRQGLRSELADRLKGNDQAHPIRAVESAYREAWKAWVRKQ